MGLDLVNTELGENRNACHSHLNQALTHSQSTEVIVIGEKRIFWRAIFQDISLRGFQYTSPKCHYHFALRDEFVSYTLNGVQKQFLRLSGVSAQPISHLNLKPLEYLCCAYCFICKGKL
jgi:hypothetical protein